MKTYELLCLGAICVPMALATPTCVSGDLPDYVKVGDRGGNFDGITFSNFQYVTSALNAAPPSDSSIAVVPFARVYYASVQRGGIFTDELLYAMGFRFIVNFGLTRIEGRSRQVDMDILYRAASAAGINEAVAYVSLGGDDLSTAASYTDISGRFCSATNVGGPLTNGCGFERAQSIEVDHHLYISVGPAHPYVGGAGISSLEFGVANTPEPAGWLSCCTALVVLTGVARLRKPLRDCTITEGHEDERGAAARPTWHSLSAS